MTDNQSQNEMQYGFSLYLLNRLLALELVTPAEHRRIKTILIKKYRPVIGSLREADSAAS